jgi:hypothetical protein
MIPSVGQALWFLLESMRTEPLAPAVDSEPENLTHAIRPPGLPWPPLLDQHNALITRAELRSLRGKFVPHPGNAG